MKTTYDRDHVVLNNYLEAAVRNAVHTICTVRLRIMLYKELVDQINETFVSEGGQEARESLSES